MRILSRAGKSVFIFRNCAFISLYNSVIYIIIYVKPTIDFILMGCLAEIEEINFDFKRLLG